jgi:acetyl esterase/lipase
MHLLKYMYLKVAALVLRALVTLHGYSLACPDAVHFIPSRDEKRAIKIFIYEPLQQVPNAATPVLINFHGGGYIVSAHGSDDDFCEQMSRKAGHTVLDVQYRVAPEKPFPHALQDAEDVLNWVFERPDRFDPSRVSISGFSAGGNLALALATSSNFPPKAIINTVLSFYPAVDFVPDPSTKKAPVDGGLTLPPFLLRLFKSAFIQSSELDSDPRVSPTYVEPERFPKRMLFVTTSYDNLADETEQLASRIAQLPDRQIVCHRARNCIHAWDKFPLLGVEQTKAKMEVYSLAEDMLQSG